MSTPTRAFYDAYDEALAKGDGREVTLRLTHAERDTLHELAASQDLPVERVLIQALRHYQLHTVRARQGLTSVWVDATGARVEDDHSPGCPDLGD